MTVGEKIRKIRVIKGYSLENMAEMLGISVTAYGNIERSETDLKQSRLDDIARVLSMTAWDILAFGEEGNVFITGNGHGRNVTNYWGEEQVKELLHKLEKTELERDFYRKEVEHLKVLLEKPV